MKHLASYINNDYVKDYHLFKSCGKLMLIGGLRVTYLLLVNHNFYGPDDSLDFA